ncbi:sensor domain-containing diguanylate cyclase [Granulosicoccus antarcticus]|uniref:sensor domain-containing diguanylate cyclase n=1 Tax=Granulosicoccus antarcticus TaxID=437505 RepID=UPI00146FC0D8|nr:diguanylate cyclase [Granulosicoccus antarcticus]
MGHPLADIGGYADPLEPPVSVLEDPTGELTIADIVAADEQFSTSIGASFNFGFTRSAYWFATQLERPANGNSLFLKISYPLLDQIDLYLRSDDGRNKQFAAGDSFEFDTRQVNHRAFIFPIFFEPGEQTLQVYLRVKTTSAMQVPISVWDPEAFHSESYDEQIVLGLYYGLLLAIMVSNIMLALSVREPVYAYYSAYIMFYGGFQLCLNGLAFEYLWPTSTYLAQKGTVMFMALSAVMATAFSAEILEIKKESGRLRACFIAFGLINMGSVLLCIALPYSIAIQLQTLLTTAGTILFFCAGMMQLRRGVAAARYYLFAWTMFLLGIFIYSLKTYAVLPENVFTEYAIQVGSAMETLLLSFAIAHRFKVLREDKLRLQSESTELLETRVSERTLELEQTLLELSTVNSRLEKLSIVDPLSGLFNRAYFNGNFDRMWKLAQEEQRSMAMLMIDIDHFKQVNDKHGHLVGDNVISVVSKLISDTVSRKEDFVVRYGGEEFAVVLPDTDLQMATVLAEKIRVAVNEFVSELEAVSRVGRISVSIGVAGGIPAAADSEAGSETLLSQADSALYDAKNQGRNRVCRAPDSHSQEPFNDPDFRKVHLG